MNPTSIYGPLISVADAAPHIRMFGEVFGMRASRPRTLPRELSAQLFGTGDTAATLTALRTPGTLSGVVLCAFDPLSPSTVRTFESRLDRDALKVVDFYAPDYRGSVDAARAKGYTVVESEAEYELPDGVFREAHLWGPDHVVTAFLGGPAAFFEDFAQVTDRATSEVQSISAPVSDAVAVTAFYEEVFGWKVVYEYRITDHSFAELIGAEGDLGLRAVNVGRSTREPYLGLIDYGLADGGASLSGRAVPPLRGLLGVVVLTEALDRCVGLARQACPGQRHDSAAGPFELEPFGRVRAGVVHPPHGVLHLVVEVAP